jgi:predicted ribosome quality control (RQC) complex YloA/Tae2 family protein
MGMFISAKCEDCWERIENCTCGKYERNGGYDTAIYRDSNLKKVSAETIKDYENEIDQLKKRLKKLEDELNKYKNYVLKGSR